MALEYNIYLAPQIGDGAGPATAYRPALADVLDGLTGEWFSCIDNWCRRMCLVIVAASPATHQTIQAQSGVTRIIPAVSVPLSTIRANFDSTLTDVYTGPQLAALEAAFEAAGIPTDWASGSTTVRQLLRFLARHHTIAQTFEVAGTPEMKSFLLANLDATVGSLPVAVRNAAKAWMDARGIATGWITGSTLVREVLKRIQSDGLFPSLALGGEDL